MPRSRAPLLRRALFVIAAGTFLWAMTVALTGGFYFRIFGFRVSSRDYGDALAIGLLSALTAIGLAWWIGGRQTVRDEWSWLASHVAAIAASTRRLASRLPTIAPAAAVATVGIALDIAQWASARPLWLDEETILLNVRDRSWSELGGSLWLGQSAPFGWLVAERAALVTLGAGELALRLVPLLFGIATIVVALWIGRRWMSPIGGTVLVLLCVFGQFVSHYAFEAKHYSADTFWAMLLPALAVWATEGEEVSADVRRPLLWWIAAAGGQMMANGALLVAPGCALFLGAAMLRRGRRAAVLFTISGLLFLAALGLHYELSLRATHESAFLHGYWANELPRNSMGLFDRVFWIGGRLEALAVDPGGTGWSLSLWISAALGLALSSTPALGLVFATVPLSAFILSGLRIVPFYDRFVLWIVPALYVGLAMAADRAARVARDAYLRRRWVRAALALLLLVTAGTVCFDIYRRGKADIGGRIADHKHHLDDRAAVRWLTGQLRPGDALMTSRLGWPAVWWYGDISIANTDADGVVHHPDGVPLLEVEHVGPGSECQDDSLRQDLQGYERLLVYVGFEGPPGFDFLVLHRLEQLGAIEAFREFSERGRAAVINLRDPVTSGRTLKDLSPKTARNAGLLDGCIRVGAARRW